MKRILVLSIVLVVALVISVLGAGTALGPAARGLAAGLLVAVCVQWAATVALLRRAIASPGARPVRRIYRPRRVRLLHEPAGPVVVVVG